MTRIPDQSNGAPSVGSGDAQMRPLQKALGLKNPALADRLVRNETVKPILSQVLFNDLAAAHPTLSPLSDRDQAVLLQLTDLPEPALRQTTRVTSALLNKQAALLQTSGAAMAEVLEWADAPNLLPQLRAQSGSTFSELTGVNSFTVAALDSYAKALEPYVLGLLPDRLFQQRCLSLPDGAVAARIDMTAVSDARTALMDRVSEALDLQSNKGGQNALR